MFEFSGATVILFVWLFRCQVEVEVEAIDKAGNFIGWVFVDNTNLSVALVEVNCEKKKKSNFAC